MKFLWNNAKRNVRQDLAWTAGYPNTIAYPFTIRTGTGPVPTFSTSPSWNIDQSTSTNTLTAAPTGNTINALSSVTCNGTNESIFIPPLADSGIRSVAFTINNSTISISAPTVKKASLGASGGDMFALSSLDFSSLQEGDITLENAVFSSVVSFPSYVGGAYTIFLNINDVNVDFPNLQSLYYLSVYATVYAGNFSKLTTIAKLDLFAAGNIVNFPLLESITDGDHQSSIEALSVYGKFTNSVSTFAFYGISHIEISMLNGSIIVDFLDGVGFPFSLFANGATILDIVITTNAGGVLDDWDRFFAHANSKIITGSTISAPTPTGGYSNLDVVGLVAKGFTVSLI